jgi:hypothetical protein
MALPWDADGYRTTGTHAELERARCALPLIRQVTVRIGIADPGNRRDNAPTAALRATGPCSRRTQGVTRMLKQARTVGICAGAVACCAIAASALATHSWGGYHWARTTAQFTLQLGDNMSADWKPYLAQASSDWNSPTLFGASSTPLLTAIVAGQSNRRCSLVAGTTQVCNGKYGNNGWLGLATISITGGEHITQGSAKMNDTYFAQAKYNTPNEKQHVVCQEVAHTFGLDHQSTDGSSQNTCMDYFSNTGANAGSTASTRPNAHDFEELNAIYAHLDVTTTVATRSATLAARFDEVTEDPITWGSLVRQSANGRSSVYQQFHRDGTTSLTHVYWTEESAAACPSCDHRVYR